MKAIASGLQTSLRKHTVRLAVCWKMTRQDGTVFSFTSHDRSLTVSGVTYKPTDGFQGSSLDTKDDMSVNNTDMVVLTSSAITEDDLEAGRFDGAALEIFAVDWSDVSLGTARLAAGTVGEVETLDVMWRAEVRGKAQAIQQPIVKLTAITCRADLGEAVQCKVDLDPQAWTSAIVASIVVSGDAGAGTLVQPTAHNTFYYEAASNGTGGGGPEPTWPTVVGSTVVDGTITWRTIRAWIQKGVVTQFHDRMTFFDAALTDVAGYYQYGKVTWTSGLNNGLAMDIREFFLGGGIVFAEPAPFDIAIGDTFDVQAGCAKRVSEDCTTKFNNIFNFDGEPFQPGEFAATEFPDAK